MNKEEVVLIKLDPKPAAIRLLDSLEPGDFEISHAMADFALLQLLRGIKLDDVADAFERARDRCGFQYA